MDARGVLGIPPGRVAWVRVALAAVIVLTTASLAFASPEFSATFHLTYLSRTPGAQSGQVPLMTWTDRGAPAEVPKIIKRIVLTFHKGTRFDTSALPRCRTAKASDCPKATTLGTGHTTGVFASGAEFVTDVTLFNGRGEIIVLVTLNGTPVTEFRDRVKGRKITIEPVLPSGVALKRLKLHIGRHSTYMTNPPSCPRSRKWTTTARFTYADGTAETLRSTSPCKPS
jgi:hypothetical protein